MTDVLVENNVVTVAGEVVSDLMFDHENRGEKFYMMYVSVKRMSGKMDIVPLKVSEKLIDVNKSYVGLFAKAEGQFRSFNYVTEERRKLLLFVFVKKLSFGDELEGPEKNNYIVIDGYIVQQPVYRETPHEERLQIFIWLLIVHMGKVIIFRVFAGEEIRILLPE